jgi:glutamate/tyrosine decarboxylase-like PLP-dependent enzyme
VVAQGAPSDLAAIDEADSVAVDPHKWLYAPLEVGCTLVRDPATLAAAFSYQPPYYHFDSGESDPPPNYYELGPQNSRGFRALKVWLGLRHAGREGYVRMIRDDIALAGALFEAVRAHPELEAITLSLSIATFRYVPPGWTDPAAIDDVNREILEKLQSSGEAFLSNAVVDGKQVLRACIVNFRTTLADVEALPGIVARLGREADQALRPAALRAATPPPDARH